MHRLFVAIQPPPDIRDRLLAQMGGIAGARWQTDAQLHLTLRFIGEVDRHLARDIAAGLGAVRAPSFKLRLASPGVFDKRGHIDTLWMGVAPQDEVAALAKRVDQALVRVGLAAETRAFLPHITLARFGKTAGSIRHFLDQPPVAAPPFRVEAFNLYESRLTSDGPHYEIVERYAFASA
jgi:2'-5' RNA ligase